MTNSIVIVGSGITGLASAYILSLETTRKITIVARDLPGDNKSTAWASPWYITISLISNIHLLYGNISPN
jgi:glycine/D-amino acid oxidase-like deaminating enzyme